MAEKKPLYKRTWFIVIVVLLLLSGVGNAIAGDDPAATESSQLETSPTPTPSETLEPEASPSPEPSQEDSPLSDPNSEESIAYFAYSATGQFLDIDKDLDDAIRRAKADQTIRLLGNILELSFNLGQLKALDAPSAVADSWAAGLVKLEASIDVASDLGTDFAAGEATTSQITNALEKVRGQVKALAKVIAKVE
jgi:hypothetical protein